MLQKSTEPAVMRPMTLARKLRTAIDRAGFRRSDVARRAGVPPQRITEWCDAESGRKPSLEQALRLVQVLRVPLDWLADPEAAPEPPPPPLSTEEWILVTAFRRTGLAVDEAVRWLWLGHDACDKSTTESGRDATPRGHRPGRSA